ncbi:hypothetical protein EYF80_030322 [Liparis tanakae]|uniref:Uncharacterized protein n=1 Tax=Liparis tanakae TaxID=230148 RepID=A0A4Z2H0W1_9TELE|nr:hypothetical protein EYF80_030322 [Liparis tanakae]
MANDIADACRDSAHLAVLAHHVFEDVAGDILEEGLQTRQADLQGGGSYFGLQVLGAAGVHVKFQQFAQEVRGGHGLGVLRGVVTYLPDGPGGGRLDVRLLLLGQTQGQLGHTLQDGRTHSTIEFSQYDLQHIV